MIQATSVMIQATSVWPHRLDICCLYLAALFPVALIIGNAPFEAVIALTGVCWLVRCGIGRYNPVPNLLKHPLILPWLAWYCIMVISLLVNGPGDKGFMHDLVFIRQFLFVAALLDIAQRLPVTRYLICGLAGGIIWSGGNMLMAYLVGYDLLGTPLIDYQSKIFLTGRIAGIAAYAAPFFCCFALLRTKESVVNRMSAFALGGLSFFLVIHSSVRTCIIAAFIGLLGCLAYYVLRRYSKKTLLLFLAGIVLVLGALLPLTNVQPEKLTNLSSLYARFIIWDISFKIWQEHPLIGTSVSALQDVYEEKVATLPPKTLDVPGGGTISSKQLTGITHAHNHVLELLTATGIFGLAAFCWLFVQLVRVHIKNNQAYPELISLLLVFMVIGLAGYNIYHSWYHSLFAYIVALSGAPYFLIKKQKS